MIRRYIHLFFMIAISLEVNAANDELPCKGIGWQTQLAAIDSRSDIPGFFNKFVMQDHAKIGASYFQVREIYDTGLPPRLINTVGEHWLDVYQADASSSTWFRRPLKISSRGKVLRFSAKLRAKSLTLPRGIGDAYEGDVVWNSSGEYAVFFEPDKLTIKSFDSKNLVFQDTVSVSWEQYFSTGSSAILFKDAKVEAAYREVFKGVIVTLRDSL